MRTEPENAFLVQVETTPEGVETVKLICPTHGDVFTGTREAAKAAGADHLKEKHHWKDPRFSGEGKLQKN